MVLGHGVPVIYINGRKIRDQGELERLRADDILSAEVITTPGVEYGSDVSFSHSYPHDPSARTRDKQWISRCFFSGTWL